MTAHLSVAEQRAVESCEGGVWLACDESARAYLWPRCVYPALDDALIADHWLNWPFHGGVGPDLEDWLPFTRCRLVWAWEHDPGSGYWQWQWERPGGGRIDGDGSDAVECWELS